MLALVFFLSAGLALMKAAQSGIFLSACSRAAIPWAFAASSILLAVLSAGFVSLARRHSTARLGELSLAVTVIALLVLRALLGLATPSVAFATYAVIEALSGVLVIQVWSVATAATDARTARRLLPVAGIGSGLAWTIAGFVVAPLARELGAPSLLLIAPACLVLALILVRAIARHDLAGRAHAPARGAGTEPGSLVRTLRFVGRVPLLRIMTALSLLALIVEEVMDFHVMGVAREELAGAEALSAFFGRYYAITSGVGLLLLAGPAARILGRLGATRALAATPLVTLLIALVAAAIPGLGPAVVLRGTARVLKQTLWSNSQEQMQSPIAHARRAETRAAIRGVLAPLGYGVAAVMLALVPPHVDGRWLAALTAVLSLVMLLLVLFRARVAYVGALERAVDERRLVLGIGRLRRAPAVDVEAAEILAREIRSEDPERAELAAEVLGAAPPHAAAPSLALGLLHASADVRAASADSLGRLATAAGVGPLVSALATESELGVRRAIVRALRSAADASAEVLAGEALARALAGAESEPDPQVRATLLALSARRGRRGLELGAALLPLLRADDPEVRRAALAELTGEALLARGVTDAVRRSIEHGSPDERVDAAETAIALGVVALLPDVVGLLRDARVSTRVARLLVALGDDAFASGSASAGQSTVASLTILARRIASSGSSGDGLVRKLLGHRDRAIRRAAVHALAEAIRAGERRPVPPGVALPLVEEELRLAYGLVAVDHALGGVVSHAPDLALLDLRREVALRLDASRADVLVLLALFLEPEARGRRGTVIEAIEASRRAPSPERDAQVAELLEHAIDHSLDHANGRSLREALVGLFEHLSVEERLAIGRRAALLEEADASDVIDRIVATGDLHLRRMAAATFRAEYARAHPALHAEDEPMIPRFERIRFLRRVPLFATLPGEDLVSVAAVLEELRLEDGEQIFHRGDRGEDLFVVVRGKVEIGEPDHVLATLGEAEFFGDLAVLDHEGRSADARSRGATQLLRLRGADLRELMATRPEITQGIVRVLVARLRDAAGKLSS